MTASGQAGRGFLHWLTSRSWPLLTAAFGGLVLLMYLSGVVLNRHTSQVRDRVDEAHKAYLERDKTLGELRFLVLTQSIELRDFLLDTSRTASERRKLELVERRQAILRSLADVERLLGRDGSGLAQDLRQRLDNYWKSIDVALQWTPAEKREKMAGFLKERAGPTRQAVLEIIGALEAQHSALLSARQESVYSGLSDIQSYLLKVGMLAVVSALAIAGLAMYRTTLLENRTERHRRETERISEQLRQLSHRLVKAQEDERKSISRELHDEVGQTLTALRMELGNLAPSPANTNRYLTAAVALAEQALKAVRTMARGLRPSILDDLGLGPALQWQAREFGRHTNLDVQLQIDGSLESLPEPYRVCVYRVVQEGLTNCAKHARAKQIRVTLHGGPQGLSLAIQDNGVGYPVGQHGREGIGLVGIRERVRELGGQVTIFSEPERGTLLKVLLPAPKEVSA